MVHAGNSINGTLPAAVAQCTLLTFLSLKGNTLSGTIPTSYLSELTSLVYLSLVGSTPSHRSCRHEAT